MSKYPLKPFGRPCKVLSALVLSQVTSYELCGVIVGNSRTSLLLSFSEVEKAGWKELEGRDTKLKALFSFSLPHLIFKVNISTVLLLQWHGRAAQKHQLPL